MSQSKFRITNNHLYIKGSARWQGENIYLSHVQCHGREGLFLTMLILGNGQFLLFFPCIYFIHMNALFSHVISYEY